MVFWSFHTRTGAGQHVRIVGDRVHVLIHWFLWFHAQGLDCLCTCMTAGDRPTWWSHTDFQSRSTCSDTCCLSTPKYGEDFHMMPVCGQYQSSHIQPLLIPLSIIISGAKREGNPQNHLQHTDRSLFPYLWSRASAWMGSQIWEQVQCMS